MTNNRKSPLPVLRTDVAARPVWTFGCVLCEYEVLVEATN
jgi:hypothetical protein